MRTVRTKVYQFSELSDEAKKKAVEKFRDVNVNYDWWDFTYEDFASICKTIGIDADLKRTYFRGFWSQGDGAGVTADIDVIKLIDGIEKQASKEYAPKLEAEAGFNPGKCPIDRRVIDLIRRDWIQVSASLKGSGHRGCYTSCNFSYDFTYNECVNYKNIKKQMDTLETWIEDIGQEIGSLLYRLLQNEYEYQTSDEAIIETIEANEYEFTEDGRRF